MRKNKQIKTIDRKEYLAAAIKKDDEEIKKYEKLLKIRKRKNKSKSTDIFSLLGDEEEDEEQEDKNEEEVESDEEVEVEEDLEDDEELEEGVDGEEDEEIEEEPQKKKRKDSSKKEIINEDFVKIKRTILSHLNKLCESQMMKCLDGIEDVWNEYPRGDVRDIFIKESMNYMNLSCVDLAAFVASLHMRLLKQTNLIAFYMEHLVQKISDMKPSSWINDAQFNTALMGHKFIAYLTRLEVIDTNLIMDLMNEMIASDCDIPQLKVLSEILTIVGFFLRKHNNTGCDEFIETFNDRMASRIKDAGDISEIRSLCQAVVDKITSVKAKNDVMCKNMASYRKMMKTWCKKSLTNEHLALRLSDFRGENRVRWWLVGSGVNPNMAHNKAAGLGQSGGERSEQLTAQEQEWNETAANLGFTSDGKKCLFRYLMQGKLSSGSQDFNMSETIMKIKQLSHSKDNCKIVSEPEIVNGIVRCLILEKEFCQFYVNLLAGLMETHRRFRQLIKCAIWDVLGQPKLIDSSRINCGRCLGQLIAEVSFPVNCLRKFNFLDDSSGNVGFMEAVILEIVEESVKDINRLLEQMTESISIKFVSNLRIFLKKRFLENEDKTFSKLALVKINKCVEKIQELRKTHH